MAIVRPPPETGLPLPSPTHRGGRSAPSRIQRVALVALLALLAAAGVAIAANFAWPWTVYEDPLFYAGRTEQFPPGTVTSVAAVSGVDGNPGFHIVRLEDGELLALLDKDPHLGCAVLYRPDFVFGDRAGWFRNPCHGETYDMAGQRVFGPSPRGLDRLAVEVRDGGI